MNTITIRIKYFQYKAQISLKESILEILPYIEHYKYLSKKNLKLIDSYMHSTDGPAWICDYRDEDPNFEFFVDGKYCNNFHEFIIAKLKYLKEEQNKEFNKQLKNIIED